MDNLKLHTPDFIEVNIAKLAELFPNCVTETLNEKGELKKAIDFDLLKQELSTSVVEGQQERYQLNWPGKREALLTANAPIAKTLRPCREESVDFDTTQNLFIEGDNLDALKLLQETYLGKVKMIYIDPPYNTGNDFVYNDKFTTDKDKYDLSSGQLDEKGNRLVDEEQFKKNQTSNGRFHSDWLSMIYPRLKLARNLLKDDGVIFISIDDNEQANLKRLCDEVFGEDNFVADIIWKKRSGAPNDKIIGAVHEYILVFSKSIEQMKLLLMPRSEELDSTYTNPDNDPRGEWKAGDLSAGNKGGRATASCIYKIINPLTGEEHLPPEGRRWVYNKDKVEQLLLENRIWFGSDNCGKPKYKRFLTEVRQGVTLPTLFDDVGTNTKASSEFNSIFDEKDVFETPKPIDLLKRFLQISTKQDDITLDFFSGSATTAHAMMQLNAEDNGKRKFIMVQLPEVCDEKSEAFKAGYKTIAEIGKERIRRVGKIIKRDNIGNPEIDQLDIGFRVLKIDSSNMKDVYYKPDQLNQAHLDQFTDNIKDDRTAEDFLFQVLLDWGVDLTLPITQETIAGKTVLFVDGNALAACFDADINEGFVKELATRHPLRAVFRDAGFVSDSVKINVEQVFRLISPTTEIKVI